MPHLGISHQPSTPQSRRGCGPAGPDPPRCSLLCSPCPDSQASEDSFSSQAASVLARAPGLGQGSGDSYKNNNLPSQLPGLLTRPTAVSVVGWPLCLAKVPSSPGRLASPGSRCWWLGRGAKRSFRVTSGPCTVDNMLRSRDWTSLTHVPSVTHVGLWTRVGIRGLKTAEKFLPSPRAWVTPDLKHAETPSHLETPDAFTHDFCSSNELNQPFHLIQQSPFLLSGEWCQQNSPDKEALGHP